MSLFDALPPLLLDARERHADFSLFLALKNIHLSEREWERNNKRIAFCALNGGTVAYGRPYCLDHWETTPLLGSFDGEALVLPNHFTEVASKILGIADDCIKGWQCLEGSLFSFKLPEHQATPTEGICAIFEQVISLLESNPIQGIGKALLPIASAGNFDILVSRRDGLVELKMYNLFGGECGRLEEVSTMRNWEINGVEDGNESDEDSTSTCSSLNFPTEIDGTLLDPKIVSPIVAALQEMGFNTDNLEPDESFFSFGLDSLELVELEQRLSPKFHMAAASLGRDTTLRSLVEFVSNSLPDSVVPLEHTEEAIPQSSPSKWQRRILLTDALEPANRAQFNETIAFKLVGKEAPNVTRLREIVLSLLMANPNLRSLYSYQEKVILSMTECYIWPDSLPTSTFFEMGLDPSSAIPVAWNLYNDEFSFNFHHVAVDGHSMQLLLKQFSNMLEGKENPLDRSPYAPPIPTNIEHEESQQFMAKDRLPTDFPPSSSSGSRRARVVRRVLPPSFNKFLRMLRSSCRCTDFELFFAAFSLLMNRRYGTRDVSLGTAVSVRGEQQLGTVDCLVSVVPVALEIDDHSPLLSLLADTVGRLSHTKEHIEDIPTGQVQILLVLDKVDSFSVPGMEILETAPVICKYDQTWYFRKTGGNYEIVVEYCSDLYRHTTIKSTLEDLLRTIKRVSSLPTETSLSTLRISKEQGGRGESSRRDYPLRLVSSMLDNQKNYAWSWTCGETSLNRTEVFRSSSQLPWHWEQRYLQQYGEVPTADRQIVVSLPRGLHLGQSVLASWNLGMSIVPISRDWPELRITSLVKRLHNPLVVADNLELVSTLKEQGIGSILHGKYTQNASEHRMRPRMSNVSMGYITCTSGSTGVPKAVCSSIRGLSNLAMNYTREFCISSRSRVYQVVNYAFDIFFADLCKSLANGASMVFAEDSLPNWNELKSCSNAYIMPAVLSALPQNTIRKMTSLESLQFGGERMHPAALDNLLRTGISLYQEFGLTEQCVYSSFLRLRKGTSASQLGVPYGNIGLCVRDSNGNLVESSGAVGELHVRGFTARGYHGLEERNRERFVDGEFATRDQVVFYENSLVFVGRMDLQVKVLGRRIELPEIEAVICRHPAVKGVVATASEYKIYAHVRANTVPTVLLQFAALHLPDYMVPEQIVIVDEFPLNANGKIDKTRLVIPADEPQTEMGRNPTTDVERIVCEAMSQILGRSVAANDCFFKSGGNSVKAMLVLQLLKEQEIAIGVKEFFHSRTAENMAKLVEGAVAPEIKNENVGLKMVEAALVPLSHVQRRLWFLQKFSPNSDAYSFKLTIRFESTKLGKIKGTLLSALNHNPFLRSSIVEADGIPFWKDHSEVTRLPEHTALLDFKFCGQNQVTVSFNHLVIDGRSLTILAEQMARIFEGEPLPPAKLLKVREEETDQQFWSDCLKDYDQTNFPQRNKPLSQYPAQLGRRLATIPKRLLVKLCHQLGCDDLFPILLLTVAKNMRKVFDEEDILLGIAVANRTVEDYDTVGMYANTLPIRLKGDLTVPRVQEQLHNVLEHQNAGLDTIQRLIGVGDLIKCVVNYQNISLVGTDLSFGQISLEPNRYAQFPLSWIFSDSVDGQMSLNLEYDMSIFAPENVIDFSDWFLQSLTRLVLPKPEIVKEDKTDFPKTSIDTMLLGQAARSGKRVAFESKEQSMNFDEARNSSLKLVYSMEQNILQKMGRAPQSDDVVAIHLEEGLLLHLAINSILLLGCAYTVLPVSSPEERRALLLEESSPTLVLHSGTYSSDTFPSLQINLMTLTLEVHTFFPRTTAHDLMYVMFTSGSTGKPKGVPISNLGVMNMLAHATRLYNLRPGGRVLQFTKSHFDASISNKFGAAGSGSTLCLLHSETEAVEDVMSHLPLDVLHMTPSVLDYIWENGSIQASVESWSIGGESPSAATVHRLLSCGSRLVQLYGPTEATCYQTAAVLKTSDTVNCIGSAVPNLPSGVLSWDTSRLNTEIGQFFCSGIQLSRGYLNDPLKTAKSFLANPFRSREDKVLARNSKLYLTGDRVRIDKTGSLYYLGRKDQQVKISGNRIEIGEIEAIIGQAEGVHSAVVVVQRDLAEKSHLVAFYTGEERDLTDELSSRLPSHMLPVRFLRLDRMPLTANGKIDTRQLSRRKDLLVHVESETPTEKDQQVLDIYKEVLQSEALQLDSNFFQYGGHSLLAVRLVNRLQKAFGIEIPLATVFAEVTPKKMSGYIGRAGSIVPPEVVEDGPIRPSVLQLPLLRLFRSPPLQEMYTNVTRIRLLRPIPPERLKHIFLQLIKTHPILRTVYHRKGKEITCRTTDDVSPSDDFSELDGFLDIFQGYPLRLQCRGNELILKSNHAAVDGHSMMTLVLEIQKILAGEWEEGVDRTAAFHQYLKKYFETHKAKSGNYWKSCLSEWNHNCLATDFQRKTPQSFLANTVRRSISGLSSRLKQLAKEHRSTSFAVLLSMVSKAFRFLLSQPDGVRVISFPIDMRTEEFKDCVTMGVNTSMVLLPDEATIVDISQAVMKSLEHPILLNDLLPLVPGNQRLYEIMMTFDDYSTYKSEYFEVIREPEKYCKCDISFFCSPESDEVVVDYVAGLFREETIGKVLDLLERQVTPTRLTTRFEPLKDTLLLTSSQKQMFLTSSENSRVLPFIVRKPPGISDRRLHTILQLLVQRHEAFRTVFFLSDDGEPVQRVLSLTESFRLIRKSINNHKQTPNSIQLDSNALEACEDGEFLVLWLHHIVTDAWSTRILEKELADLIRNGAETVYPVKASIRTLPPPEEGKELRSEYTESLTAAVLPLVAKYSPSNVHKETMEIPKIKGHIFSTIVAALTNVLQPKQSINFGFPFANRNPKNSKIVGYFLNNLVIPVSPVDTVEEIERKKTDAMMASIPFIALVQRMRQLTNKSEALFQVYLNCRYDLESAGPDDQEILNMLPVAAEFPLEVDVDSYPQFERITVRAQAAFFKEQDIGDFLNRLKTILTGEEPLIEHVLKVVASLLKKEVRQEDNFFSLGGNSLQAIELAEELEDLLGRDVDMEIIYSASSLGEIAEKLEGKSKNLPDIGWSETKRARKEPKPSEPSRPSVVAGLPADFPKNSFHRVWENLARSSRTMILLPDHSGLTYSSVIQQAMRLAYSLHREYIKLQGRPIRPDDIIPVMGKKSPETWINCLAVQCAGAAYLPISSSNPSSKIENILREAAAVCYIGEDCSLDIPCLHISGKTKGFLRHNLGIDLAYLISTSGTTGSPKAVCVQHRGITNMAMASVQDLHLNARDVIYQFTNFCFDNSVFEVFSAMASGCQLLLDPAPFAPRKFGKQIASHGVTHCLLFPGLVSQFKEEVLTAMKGLRYWVTGAEKLSGTLFSRVNQLGVSVIQNYGPTETTCYCLTRQMKSGDLPTNLGRPIQNTRITASEQGELLISGKGLMRGYLNRTDSFHRNEQGTWYATGDVVRVGHDGCVVFVGRQDGQVKIRGHRVELGEVEEAILAAEKVEQCRVRWRDPTLTAYCVTTLSEEEVRKQCEQSLPLHMRPNEIKILKELPLTENSKVNFGQLEGEWPLVSVVEKLLGKVADPWKSLLEQGGTTLDAITINTRLDKPYALEDLLTKPLSSVSPSSREKSRVRRAWNVVLSHDTLNPKSHFLLTGGTSLHVLKLRQELAKQGLELPVQKLMQNLVLEEMEKLDGPRTVQILADPKNPTRTVVLVHPLYGGAAAYLHLVPLLEGEGIKLVALEHPNTFGFQTQDIAFFESIDSLSQVYSDQLGEHLEGEVILCGVSIGGTLAVAIAEKLKIRPKGVVVVDTLADPVLENYSFERHKELLLAESPLFDTALLANSWDLLKMLSRHQWHHFHFPITLLSADRTDLGWKRFCSQVTIIPIDGPHSALLSPPAVSAVSNVIPYLLRQIMSLASEKDLGDTVSIEGDRWRTSSTSLPAPKDRFYLVYGIFLLHGVGMLMSWNMFITIAPQYYRDYWFTFPNGTSTKYADSFMSVLGVTSQIPNVGVMFFNAAIIMAGYLMLRIVIPLFVNCLLVALIIVFVIFVQPDDDRSNAHWFYIVTLVIILLMNLMNGIYQSSVYGIAADMPDNYINSLVIGNNLCGVFTSLMSIFTTLASADDIKLNALLYFSISLAILVVCVLSLAILVQQPFYQHYINLGKKARAEDDAEKLSLRQYWECFTYCWVQLFNNFFVYFVSLVIFPAMMTDTPYYAAPCPDANVTTTQIPGGCGEWKSPWPENLYFAINTFLNFNVFAFAGSWMANYIQFPKPKWLVVPVLLRVLFIPFFMYCNYLPGGTRHTLSEVIFKSEWFPTIGCTVLAWSCGYFSSLALIYTPSGVPASYQSISGMYASIFLMLGILAGVSFTPVISAFVKAT